MLFVLNFAARLQFNRTHCAFNTRIDLCIPLGWVSSVWKWGNSVHPLCHSLSDLQAYKHVPILVKTLRTFHHAQATFLLTSSLPDCFVHNAVKKLGHPKIKAPGFVIRVFLCKRNRNYLSDLYSIRLLQTLERKYFAYIGGNRVWKAKIKFVFTDRSIE